ncbi:cytochrome c [Sulfurimonas sp. SAG-AH-194-C21]|nr:c-type cytochrome [Sulfurimonas sp. SAG-AH-194-C21]MDF1883461.1 cytochrome c [Sulfurimonas sp. SAG-AH-194-C21]
MRFILLLFLTFTSIFAETSYEKGKKLYISSACYSCHGHKLEGIHRYPYLANRAKGYMSYKLKHFRAKKADTQRQEMMITFAVGLSDEDIDNLTTYFRDYVDEKNGESYDDSYENFGDGGS